MRPVRPQRSASSPSFSAYARIAVSTESMCLRSDSLAVYSCMSARVSSREGRESVNCVLRFLTVLDDVAFLEKNGLKRFPEIGVGAHQPFEIHPEMFHLFIARILHDCARGLVLFDGDALGVPVDGVSF